MQINRFFFITFIFLLISLFSVSADWLSDGSCQLNTNCIISRQVINDTSGDIIPDANCTINIYNINNSLLFNETMLNLTNGFYNYTVNMNETGQFPSIMYCFYKETCLDVADVTFTVSDPHLNEYLYLILFIIPIILYVLWRRDEEQIYLMFSGFVLIDYGIAIYMEYFPRLVRSTLLMDGFALIIMALGVVFILVASIRYVQEVG